MLDDINASAGDDGSRIYTIGSTSDAIVGYGGLVYGVYTSRIPGQDGDRIRCARSFRGS